MAKLSKETIAAAKKYGPTVDDVAKQYGISGAALLAKVVSGESGDNPTAVSPAGARGRAQFMPGSRDVAVQKFGVDPWSHDADQAVHAAALHLRGLINGSKGLQGYNPGSPTYTSYILGQKVGNVSGGTKVKTPSAAAAAPDQQSYAPGTPAVPGVDNSAQRRLALGAYLQQGGVGNSAALPGFVAAYSQAADVPGVAAVPGAKVKAPKTSTSTQASASGPVYPTGPTGKVIGTPYAGTHTLGNWQSDNAVDLAVPIGTPMLALQDGVIVKVTKHPQGSGRFAGDQITVRGKNGNEYFYAHGVAKVKAGQKVKRGQSIGTTGSANGVAHLHFGQERGDPRQHTK